ncbi:MAG: hypothetical protein ACE5JG_09015, partial [Planctomycetota bacterium]
SPGTRFGGARGWGKAKPEPASRAGAKDAGDGAAPGGAGAAGAPARETYEAERSGDGTLVVRIVIAFPDPAAARVTTASEAKSRAKGD